MMNIIITGLNNYLGKRLAIYLANEGNDIWGLVRNETHFLNTTDNHENIHVIKADLVREKYAPAIPDHMDVAIYLSQDSAEWNDEYRDLELLSLNHFIKQARRTNAMHLVYITRLRTPFVSEVQELLSESYMAFTLIRMSNIIGKDSILMQMMNKLSSRMVIVANRRLVKKRAQPIALSDLLIYINFILLNPTTFNQVFDIGGIDVLSYREMLQIYMDTCHIKRKIISLPVLHNEISAIFTSLSTGVNVSTARALGEHITGDLICEDNKIHNLFPHDCLHFKDSIVEALKES